MPTEKSYGTVSGANKAIGGVPTLHYLDFLSRGRGQVLRLLFEDAGIAYHDVRYNMAEFRAAKHGAIAALNPAKTVPVVELAGTVLVRSYPMMRLFARQLHTYDGATEDEKYWVDAMCDVGIDWRTLFAQTFDTPESATHQATTQPQFAEALDKLLSGHALSADGPFVIGQTLTYADLVIYQIIHDEDMLRQERKGLDRFPRLKQLVDAVEARPRIKAYLESDRYLG